MRFHKEGVPTLLVVSVIVALAWLSAYLWGGSVILMVVTLLGLVLIALILNFFRNPPRPINNYADNHIYAPADGKVVVIEEVDENEYFKERRIQVSIFMSPLNVHVNRYPIAGEVTYAKHHHGKFLVAWHPKSSTENERFTTVIKGHRTTLLLRQIAGALARRIVNYSTVGDIVGQGDEMGFIKLGSRVDLLLPIGCNIKVKLNDTVSGNIDIIAEI